MKLERNTINCVKLGLVDHNILLSEKHYNHEFHYSSKLINDGFTLTSELTAEIEKKY